VHGPTGEGGGEFRDGSRRRSTTAGAPAARLRDLELDRRAGADVDEEMQPGADGSHRHDAARRLVQRLAPRAMTIGSILNRGATTAIASITSAITMRTSRFAGEDMTSR